MSFYGEKIILRVIEVSLVCVTGHRYMLQMGAEK